MPLFFVMFFLVVGGLFWAFPHSRTGLLRYKIAPQFFRSAKNIRPRCVQMLLSEPHASRRLQFLTLQARRQAFLRRLRSLSATSVLPARALSALTPLQILIFLNKKKNIERINVLFVKKYNLSGKQDLALQSAASVPPPSTPSPLAVGNIRVA